MIIKIEVKGIENCDILNDIDRVASQRLSHLSPTFYGQMCYTDEPIVEDINGCVILQPDAIQLSPDNIDDLYIHEFDLISLYNEHIGRQK